MGLEEEIEDVKKRRAVAKRRFTRKINMLRESIGENNPVSVLRSNYDEVTQAYVEIEKVNDSYIKLLYDKSASDEVIEEADQYIVELEKKKTELHVLLDSHCINNASQVNINKVKVRALSISTYIFR